MGEVKGAIPAMLGEALGATPAVDFGMNAVAWETNKRMAKTNRDVEGMVKDGYK